MSVIPLMILDSLPILERNIHHSRRNFPVVNIISVSPGRMAACVHIPEHSLALLTMCPSLTLVSIMTGVGTIIPIWGLVMVILLTKNLWTHTLVLACPGGAGSLSVLIPLVSIALIPFRWNSLGGCIIRRL